MVKQNPMLNLGLKSSRYLSPPHFLMTLLFPRIRDDLHVYFLTNSYISEKTKTSRNQTVLFFVLKTKTTLFCSRCHFLYHSLLLFVIHYHFKIKEICCHSLSFIVPLVAICCHSFSNVITRCITLRSFYKRSHEMIHYLQVT